MLRRYDRSERDALAPGRRGTGATLGLFGRLDFSSRLAGQLEISKLTIEDDYTGNAIGDIRSVTALLVVELFSRSRVHVTLMAGARLDHAETDWDSTEAPLRGRLRRRVPGRGRLHDRRHFRLGGRSADDDEYSSRRTCRR